jgi:hypothetical protein
VKHQGHVVINAPKRERASLGEDGKKTNVGFSILLPLEVSRRSFLENLSVNITYRINLIERNYMRS